MTKQWHKSIAAQALAALVLAVAGSAIWAMVLWHLGKDEGNRWHTSIRQEISIYQQDYDIGSLAKRLEDKGIETTQTPPAGGKIGRRHRGDPPLAPGERMWIRLPTQTPLWAGLESRKPPRRMNLWAWMGGMGLMLTGLAGWLAWYWIRPLRILSAAAGDIVRGSSPPSINAPMELMQLSHALGKAAETQRLASNERKLFLAGVSHDLRQPLARVQMALAVLPMEDAELQAGVERDLREMDNLLSQFVEWVRDGQDETPVQVDLSNVCLDAAEADSGNWTIDLPGQGIALITGPPIALRRAIGNVLHNATKHGKAPFSIALKPDDQGWVVTVKDHGTSAPPVDTNILLEPFTSAGVRAGAGLGLAVAHRVATRMKGKIRFMATNAEGGWTVEMHLPTAKR